MAGVQFRFLAETRGSTGVRLYLQEHRQLAPNVLHELSAPILLDDGQALDRRSQSEDAFGIHMEQLTVRVQREIWSALASGASPSQKAAEDLARAFLRVVSRRHRESDAVCVSLAKMVLKGDADKSRESTDEAFRRRMRRLTLREVKFPSQEDEDKRVATIGTHKVTTSGSGSKLVRTGVVMSQWNKRPRTEVAEDQEMVEESPRNNSPVATKASGDAQEPPPLTKEVENSASVLAKQLVQLTRSETTAAAVDDVAARAFNMLAEVVNDVHTTYATNERSFQYLCKILRMDRTSDEALSMITSSLVDSNWSSRYAAIFLETSVVPKIRSADSVISRMLLQTALRFGSSYAGTLVDSLILPLLIGDKKEESSSAFGPPQAEAITRILRSSDTVPTDQLDGFIQKSLEAMTVNANSNLLSNESVLLVFQNILNSKPVLSLLTIEKFVGACEAILERPDTEQVRGSLRFATVVFTLISKYPEQCAGHVETLEAIANQLTSIMAKTTLRSLQKLKANK